MKLLSALLVCLLMLTSFESSAKRLAGGASVGKQSGNVSQRDGVQPAAAPQAAVPGPAQSAGASAKAPAPAVSGRPWGAMLGGLAAGLGMAWLASALGFGEGFAQFLMVALLLLMVVTVVGMVVRSRGGRSRNPSAGASLAFQGAGTSGAPAAGTARAYSPQNVGNDASARPWERTTTNFDSSRYADVIKPGAAGAASSLSGTPAWGVPEGFDVDAFLASSKANFIHLQAAWDRADIPSLRAMMTDGMLEQIRVQLAEREQHSGGVPNSTEVVMIEARMLGIEELEADYMASVEFSGMIREEVAAGPSPFREVWNITRSKSGTAGWLVAGVQALQ